MKIRRIRPMFNRIVTTMDTYAEDKKVNGIIQAFKGSLKECQTVLETGPTVRDIKPGDMVHVDLTRYMSIQHKDKSLRNDIIGDAVKVSYNLNTIEMEDGTFLLLYDQDVDYIIESWDAEKADDAFVTGGQA